MKVLEGGTPGSGEQSIDTGFLFENILNAISWARLVVYSAAFLGVMLLQILQSDFLCPQVWQPINLLMFLAFSAQIAFVEFSKYEKWKRPLTSALFAVDCFVIVAVLAVLGVNHSLFLFLILLIVVLASLTLGREAGLRLGLIGATLFSTVYALSPYFDPELMRTAWLLNSFSIFAVAGLGGVLGNQIRFVSEDIKGKKEEIQSLTDFNELIVDNIPSGLLVVNSDFEIVRANRGAAKIFGDLSLEGRNLSEVFNDLLEELQSYMVESKNLNFKRMEINYYTFKREKLVLEVILSATRSRQEISPRYIILLQNLTEIKNLEFAMRQKEKLAAVGQLAAGIAHEIRNPLASISGSIQLLETSLQVHTAEDKKLLAIVIKEIDRLNRLISEFLDFVRPHVRVEDPINLNGLVKEVLEAVKHNDNLPKKVEQKTELRALGVVHGHYDKLKQSVLNIVINAYQAMNNTLHPEIYVQTYDTDKDIVLVIRDNGAGMSKDAIKRIFEPFHTTKPQGTGLGLAITHKIIESHNAQIFVESEVGRGAKFSIVFPSGQAPETDEKQMKKQA